MWYEGHTVDNARLVLGVPLSPLWVASAAVGQLVGVASPPRAGCVFVFSCMVAFIPATPCSSTTAAPAGSAADVIRLSYEHLDTVQTEDGALRLISGDTVIRLTAVDERSAVLLALTWLREFYAQAGDTSEPDRAAIMYPEATRRVNMLAEALPHPEYVVQDVDGTIVTNQRMFFATTVVRLEHVQMMHPGKERLKVIVNRSLILQLACSEQRQAVVVSVWLSTLPVTTDHLRVVPRDAVTGLKSHVQVLQRLHQQFCEIDESRDGVITEAELHDALGALFAHRGFVAGFFAALDANADHIITLLEFVSGMCELLASDVVQRLRFTFRMFDRNRDGTLDESELFSALHTLSATGDVDVGEAQLREVCAGLFAIMDTERTGTVSADQYCRALVDSPEVHDLFRRVGLTGDSNAPRRIVFAQRPMGASHPHWHIMASIMQACVVGLNSGGGGAGSAGGGGSTPRLSSPTGGGLGTGNDFTEIASAPLSVPEAVVRRFGYAASAPRAAGDAVVQIVAPRAFERLRTLFDIRLKSLRHALGVDNMVANMLLGATNNMTVEPQPASVPPNRFCFLSHNALLRVRAVSPEERANLALLLPQYVEYIASNPNTLLPRFLALLSILCGSAQLHFVVELNVAHPQRKPRAVVHFHHSDCRNTSPDVLHEFDLRGRIALGRGWREPLLRQLKRDVAFLAAGQFADYVLEVAVPELPLPPNAHRTTRTFMAALDAVRLRPEPQAHEARSSRLRGGCCGASAVSVKSSGGVVTTTIATSETFAAPAQRALLAQQAAAAGHTAAETGPAPTLDRAFATLAQSPAFLRGRQTPAATSGGVFYQFENGVPNANGSAPVTVALMHVLGVNPERADEHAKSVLRSADEFLGDPADEKEEEAGPNAAATAAARSGVGDAATREYPVTTETGKRGAISVDQGQGQLCIAGPRGQRLLVLNLVVAAPTLSVVRDMPSASELSRRRLTVRAGLRRRGVAQTLEFDARYVLAFDNVVAREALLSELEQALTGDVTLGLHTTTLRVFVATWNVGVRTPGDLTSLLAAARGGDGGRCDIVCVAAQGCTYPGHRALVSACDADWFTRVHAALPEYDKVAVSSVWSTRTIVLAHRSVVHQISNIAVATTGSVVGNRNAVAVGFKVADSSLCFVNVQLAARPKGANVAADTAELFDELQDAGCLGAGLLASYHHVFVAGDVRSHTNAQFGDVMAAVRSGEFDRLAVHDELVREMRAGESFPLFSEAPLTFPPTTRYLWDTDPRAPRVYDEWHHEVPSWSARILFKSLGHPADTCVCTRYGSDQTLRSSSHAPVFATFEVAVRRQYVCRVAFTNPVVALVVTHLRCEGLSRPSANASMEPWVRFHCPLFAQPPSVTRTRPVSAPHSPAWQDTLEFQVYACESGHLASEYLTMLLFDDSYAREREILGTAVGSLHGFAAHPTQPKQYRLPVMLNGVRQGTLFATVSLRFSR